MASIRQKNQKWQVQVRRSGFPAVSKTFAKKADAIAWANMMESRADRLDLPPDLSLLKTTTLAALVERYRDEIVSHKKSASVETTIVNAFLRNDICKKTLAEITIHDWNRYRDERLKEVSGKTLKRILSPLRHMFGIATREWGFPESCNSVRNLNIVAKDKRRDRRLSNKEYSRIIWAAKRSRVGYLVPAVNLCLETGLRRGELLNIQVAHIDFDRRLLLVPETKNGEPRTIPLTKSAIEILRSRLANACSQGRIFPISANTLRLSWERTCKRANVNNLHFHDLRHEAISRLFEKDLTTPEVASISGHKDIRMLFRYAHATQKSILKKFDAL